MTDLVERRFAEIIKWYEYNKNLVPKENVIKKQEFLQKTIDCQFELMVLMLENIRTLEFKTGSRSERLYLPTGITVGGDLTRFG